jgi:capsular exopolysaccharide synthesis family protein
MALAVCISTTREYTATAELQVQKEQGSQLGLDDNSSGEGSTSDALQDNISLQTQANILQSDSLALKVIHDLDLTSKPDFQPHFSLTGWALGLIAPKGPSDAQLGPSTETDLGLSPRQRIGVLAVFRHNLKVKPVAGTRLVDISYTSSDPRLAAEVVNRLAGGLSDYNFETRHDATARTARYLTSQLNELRQQSENLEAKVAVAQRESGIVSLGGVDSQGRQQVYSSVLDKLQQATAAYSQAQSNRFAKEAVYRAAQTGDPDMISSLNGSAVFSTAGGDGALALIQSLRMQQATLQGQIAEYSAKFGPAYPKLEEARKRSAEYDATIRAEVQRIAERARKDLDVAKGVEESTRQIYADLKAKADTLNDKAITYTILHQEADQSRSLYDTLFKQLKQAGILADFRISNISIVDPARVPANPTKPNIPLSLLGSIVAGLFLGGCGALLADLLDNKIHDIPDLEAYLGETPLGILPYHKTAVSRDPNNRAKQSAVITQPHGPYTEALRALRTSLMLSRVGSAPKVILITSAVSGEGKSMLSINLAGLLAQQRGCRVLLLEGDLRRPVLSRRLNVKGPIGLSTVLSSENSLEMASVAAVPVGGTDNLYFVPAGPIAPYPAELLGSQQMVDVLTAWREKFDFIIIDGAPVLPITDSVLLSRYADLTLVVARYNMTPRQSLDRTCRVLNNQGAKVGVVLNAVERSGDSYYQYFGYRNSEYYGS